jgi:hypothetical protein
MKIASAQYDALRAISTEVLPGDVISLCAPGANEKELLRTVEASNYNIYVRESYPKLASKVMDALCAKATASVGITGTPGIGKSVFLWYLIHRMLLDDRFKDRVFVYVYPDSAITLSRDGAMAGIPHDVGRGLQYISLLDGHVTLSTPEAKYVAMIYICVAAV